MSPFPIADDNVTSYTYNAAHEVATETSPTDGITTYTYDLVGNLTQSVDPDGHTIDYTYNADNEETSETWVNPEGGTPLDVFDYTYNADGELTAASDDNSACQYTYNGDGEETSQGDVGSPDLPTVTLTYSYDKDGDRTSMDDSLGGLVSYTYNARDELTNETLSGTGISAEAVANTYDNAGNMIGQTRYSNLTETTVVAATSYTYDNADQMTGITDKNSSGTTLVSYGYTYDAAGLVSQETRTWDSGADTNTLDYTYTANDQLTSVTNTNSSFANESFTYDANGNETGTGYTTSTGNEQTASPGYTYTYDADGNQITSTNTSTGDVWYYTYNFASQMTGAVEKTSSGTVLAQATYTYDALGNRIGIDDNGTQTWTLYDGSDPIMDFSSTGSLEMRYLNGPSGDLVDTVLARQSASGTVAWYLPDRLGTIRDLINNSGAIIDHVDYSAFGTVLDESDPSEGDRMMGFGGMERDTVTGINLAVFRVQDPGTGRWTSQDPLGFAGGTSDLSEYVDNDPLGGSDPSGEAPTVDQGKIGDFPAMPFWTTYLKPVSNDPASDLETFTGGCVGLQKLRLGNDTSPERYPMKVHLFATPGQLKNYLKTHPNLNNPVIIAIQTSNPLTAPVVNPGTGELDPTKTHDNVRTGGASWNYATWIPNAGSGVWEWMNSFATAPGATVRHHRNLPGYGGEGPGGTPLFTGYKTTIFGVFECAGSNPLSIPPLDLKNPINPIHMPPEINW